VLNSYLAQTQNLLQLPGSAASGLYSTANLTLWINIARGQIAGEGECIRSFGTIPTVVGQQPYTFAGISTGTSTVNGIQGVININSLSYNAGNGQLWLTPRPWPWFSLYNQNNAVPRSGPPKEWSQFGQGAAPGAAGSDQASVGGGSFYLSPSPDDVYTLNCNCICYPIPLATDSDPEAIPYL